MRRETLISILCSLTMSWDEFKTVESYFLYEFEGRKYQIHIDRDEGKLINFDIKYVGDVAHENN
jgi:hypothetical protein